jgi:hypothetical protein
MCAYISGYVSVCCDCIVHNGLLSHKRGECSNCGEVNGHYDAEGGFTKWDEYRDKGMSPGDFFSE